MGKLKKVVSLLSATASAQFITILAMPFITRIFTPEDMGSYQTFITAAAIFSLITSLKYERAIPLPKSEKDSYYLMMGICLVTIINSLLVGVFIYILPINDLNFNLVLFIFTVMFMSLFQTLNFWNTRQEMYGYLIKSRIIRSLSTVVIQLTLGYILFSNSNFLNLGYFTGYFFAVIILLIPLFNKKARIYRVDFKRLIYLFGKYKDFVKYSLPSSLLNTLSQSLPIIMLASLFNMQVVGLFSLGQRVLTLPISIFGQSISQIVYQEASTYQSDERSVSSLISTVFNSLFYIIFGPIVILLFFGTEIFSLVFGKEWSEAGEIAAILSPWLLMVFLVSPLSLIFNIYNRQKSILKFEIVLIIIRGSAIILGSLHGNYLVAIFFFSAVSTLAYIFQALWLFKITEVHLKDINLLNPLIFVVPVILLNYFSDFINSNIVLISLTVFLLGIYYVSILIFDKNIKGLVMNGIKK